MSEQSLLPPADEGSQTPANAGGTETPQDQHKPKEATADGSQEEKKSRVVDFKGEKLEVPDQYWGEGDNEFNVPAMFKALKDTKSELDKLQSDRRAPEKYEVNVPEAYKDKIPNDDPLLVAAQQYGKDKGWSQADMDANLEFYLGAQQEIYDGIFKAESDALKSMYGERVEPTLKAVDDWARGAVLNNEKIPENERESLYQGLRALCSSAAGVRLADYLRNGYLAGHMKEADVPGAKDTGGSEQITESQVKEWMNSKEYQNGDPALHKKVEAAFKQLYPE